MKFPSIRFVFDRKHKASKSTKGLVQLEVSYGGRRKWISTGVKLYSDQWDERRMVVNSGDMLWLNDELERQRRRIVEWAAELVRGGGVFDFDKLECFLHEGEVPENFIDYVAARVEERTDIRESTRRTQRKLVGSLRAFGGIVYFADITRSNIMRYDGWLHSRGYLQPTVHSYHKFLKTYINDAVRAELLEGNPYGGIKIERGRSGTRKYLTEAEVARISAAQLPTEGLARVRDLFLFQCYTGFAYADLVNFDFSRAVERGGRYVVHDTRVKTDEPFYTVLLSPAVDILRRYGFRLPLLANQQYNLQLKVVASAAGLEQRLTSHMGRHTFAVWALNHGVRIESLARMMGHSDIKTTQIYARVLDSEVERAFESLEDALSR